jgi:hypothetical protein
MSNKMSRLSMMVGSMLVLAMAQASAAENIINFEDLYPSVESTDLLPLNYNGFSWSDSSRFVTSQLVPGSGFAAGTIDNVSLFNDPSTDFSLSRAVAFNFHGAYITAAWNDHEQVTVEGYRNGVLQYTTVIDTSTSGPNYFSFNYANIEKLTIHATGGVNAGLGGEGDYVVIDNIHYSPVSAPPIPEPETWITLGLGLAALAFLGRQKRQR